MSRMPSLERNMTLDRVTKEFFENTSLKWDWRLEGAAFVNGMFTLGCRAGPESSVVNLAHEMAHFVEIEDYRILHSQWGLKFPEIEIMGRRCVMPRTHQMTDREIRTMAFQKNLLDYLGIDEPMSELVRAMTLMPDFFLIPLENGRPAYTKKGTDLNYHEVEKSKLRWIAKQVEKKRRTRAFSIQRFISEWFRKTELIRANSFIGQGIV